MMPIKANTISIAGIINQPAMIAYVKSVSKVFFRFSSSNFFPPVTCILFACLQIGKSSRDVYNLPKPWQYTIESAQLNTFLEVFIMAQQQNAQQQVQQAVQQTQAAQQAVQQAQASADPQQTQQAPQQVQQRTERPRGAKAR